MTNNNLQDEREPLVDMAERLGVESYTVRNYMEEIERLRAAIASAEQVEPVYQVMSCGSVWDEVSKETYDATTFKKRILYTRPAPSAVVETWVPVTKSMPNPAEHPRVLIYTEGADFAGQQFFDVEAETLNECFYEQPEDQPEICRAATHWMPRPDPLARSTLDAVTLRKAAESCMRVYVNPTPDELGTLYDCRDAILALIPPEAEQPAVEVCPICDIAGCKHIRARKEQALDEQAKDAEAGLFVTVDAQGVRFGNAYYSHEKITGYTAEQLNSGNCLITARAYMKWLSAAIDSAKREG